MTRPDLAAWLVVHGRTAAGYVLGVLGLAALAGAGLVLLSMLGGCSSGPQTVGQGAATSPSCAWTFTAGGETPPDGGSTISLCRDCTIERVEMSCLFDRTSSAPTTAQRGVETGPVEVSPTTSVSGIPAP